VGGNGDLHSFIAFKSHREFLRKTIDADTRLRKNGTEFVDRQEEGSSSLEYRDAVNADGSPSTVVSMTYSWMPGTELMRETVEDEV